ncbi:MAG: hydrogenase iron-sulfur subunit, partial [Desulfobulbaceae bacterium]|nr:hydrogenase iron-sulfur subunit [Desulfobulbaceae bacterium]
IRRVLEEVGIKKERYDLQWASAAEAPRFVQLITEFTDQMKELGPLGKAEGLSPEEVKERLEKALEFVSAQKSRISYGNAAKAVRKDGVWTKDHIDEIINTKMAKTLEKAFA